jgi:hypothetical protein
LTIVPASEPSFKLISAAVEVIAASLVKSAAVKSALLR